MADVVLIPEGEQGRRVRPAAGPGPRLPDADGRRAGRPRPRWCSTDRARRRSAPTGWLAHVDLPSLLLTGLRPVAGRGVTRACGPVHGVRRVRRARPTCGSPGTRAGRRLIDGEGKELHRCRWPTGRSRWSSRPARRSGSGPSSRRVGEFESHRKRQGRNGGTRKPSPLPGIAVEEGASMGWVNDALEGWGRGNRFRCGRSGVRCGGGSKVVNSSRCPRHPTRIQG